MNVSKEAREACAAYASPSTYQPGDGEKYGESLPLCQAFAKFEAEITQRVRDDALRGADWERIALSVHDEGVQDWPKPWDVRPATKSLQAAIRQMIGGKA